MHRCLLKSLILLECLCFELQDISRSIKNEKLTLDMTSKVKKRSWSSFDTISRFCRLSQSSVQSFWHRVLQKLYFKLLRGLLRCRSHHSGATPIKIKSRSADTKMGDRTSLPLSKETVDHSKWASKTLTHKENRMPSSLQQFQLHKK